MSSIFLSLLSIRWANKKYLFLCFFSKRMLNPDNNLIIMFYYHYLYILECNDKKLNSFDKKKLLRTLNASMLLISFGRQLASIISPLLNPENHKYVRGLCKYIGKSKE